MTVDILAALEATTEVKITGRCRIARWLDDIPADQPGRDVLVSTFAETDDKAEHYRRLVDLTHLAGLLGLSVSQKTVQQHRTKVCACYGRSA